MSPATGQPGSEGSTDQGFGVHSIEEFADADEGTEISFEEQWGDPTESENTDLDEVPKEAIIDFGNGVVKESSMQFFIKRAMIDEDAAVMPYGTS